MNFTIKTRLVMLGTCLAFFPTLIIGFILSTSALNEGSESLRNSAYERLNAISDLSANSIQDYFTVIQDQATSFASNVSIIEAAKEFNQAFFDYANSHKSELETRNASLKGYYTNEFDTQFKSLNQGSSSNAAALLQKVSEEAKLLQSVYISNNKAPLGEKDTLVSTQDGSEYDRVHTRYHPMIRNFQRTFGYYDVFIADVKTGHIVYSVFKELDFATSLKTGPYANTGIGEAYKAALNGATKGQTYLTDFAPYGPSYNAPAAFISTPIYDGNNMIAVLIFQMPVDRINDVITHKQEWQKNGLGKSGQSYLVGADQLLRSNVRQLYEDKTTYLEILRKQGVSAQDIESVNLRNTTIGQIKVSSPAVNNALEGKSGNTIETDYLGSIVLAVYRPIIIQGITWGIITELEENEALAPIQHLADIINKNILISSVIALIVGALLGYLFAVYITRPVHNIIHLVNDLSGGEGDLTQRLPIKGNDELTQLSQGINRFISQTDVTLSKVLKSVVRLVPISQDTAGVINELNQANETQRLQAEKVNSLLTLTNEASETVAIELRDIDSTTRSGVDKVTLSRKEISHVANTIHTMSKDLSAAMNALDKLKLDTQQITGIIDVINGIAEQTNLLALNAAIEAARAGEAGRGFAVVADEVRSLASKTRESTNEVAEMVSAIQNSTSSVTKLMESSGQSAERSVIQVNDSVSALQSVSEAMASIAEKVHEIGRSIDTQQSNFVEVTASYDKMNESFEQVREHSQRSADVGSDVMKLGEKITRQISRFTVSEKNISMARRENIREQD